MAGKKIVRAKKRKAVAHEEITEHAPLQLGPCGNCGKDSTVAVKACSNCGHSKPIEDPLFTVATEEAEEAASEE